MNNQMENQIKISGDDGCRVKAGLVEVKVGEVGVKVVVRVTVRVTVGEVGVKVVKVVV